MLTRFLLSNFFVWNKLSSCLFWVQRPLCACLGTLSGQDFDCVDDGCCMLSCYGDTGITRIFIHHQHALDATTWSNVYKSINTTNFLSAPEQQFFIP
jgi:hypothetical protein